MAPMRALPRRIRAAALISVGALAVHDLRYLLAYKGSAAHQLSVQGHGYLKALTPVVIGVLVLVLARFAVRLMRLFGGGDGREGDEPALPPTRVLWPLMSATLVAIYAGQEWIEGQVAGGHPGGLAAAFGHGGWLAVPLAVVVGLVIALALRGAEAAIAMAANARPRTMPRPRPLVALVPCFDRIPPTGGGLARLLAPRGPPPASGC